MTGHGTGVRGAVLGGLIIPVLMTLLTPHSLEAERIQITCRFEVPCEFAWHGGSIIAYYRDAATYTVVVDRIDRPFFMETYEGDFFRFVLLVDMPKNKVIATTYDKDSGNTTQMETSLDSLCKVPLKGAQYIQFLDRPQIWIKKADLRLEDQGSADAVEYRAIITDLGLTVDALPETFRVVRQGIAVCVAADRLVGDLEPPAEVVNLSP
jgi:hypothetical protein